LLTFLFFKEYINTVTRDHPHAGVILIGDFNQLHDAALLAYPLRKVAKSATRGSAVLDKIYTSLKDWYGVPSVMPNIGRSDHNAVVMTPKPRPTDRGEDIMVTVCSQDSKGRALLGKAIIDTGYVQRDDGVFLRDGHGTDRLPFTADDC